MSRVMPKARASYRILEPLERRMSDDGLDDLEDRLYTALGDFPELSGETINLGVLWENAGADVDARAFGYNRIIEVPPDEYTTNVTLYHELGHVAIRVRNENGEDHPRTSEEYCSIFSMARMPTAWVDEDRVPYLGDVEVSKGLLPHICNLALDYREENHDYIQQCHRWISGEEDYREFRLVSGEGGDQS